MSNNWNLKEHQEHIKLEGIGTLAGFTKTEYNNIGGASVATLHLLEMYYFCPSTLETLRNNLIEDIDSIDCTEKSKLNKYQIIEEVLEILDKRFGVNSSMETKG